MELTKTNATLSNSKGYKSTEVGLIPEDWDIKELSSILKFGSGQDYKHLQKGEIPVYGTGGIMTYVNSFLYNGDSVGIGRKGTIDKPIFLTGGFWTVDTLFYTTDFLDVLPKFIYFKFLTIPWKEFNEASGVPSLNKNTIEKIKIPLPPTLTEQKAIATALSDVDALISSLEKLIAKKKAIKQGAMQELLTPPNKGGRRLPGFNGEWEEKTLDSLIHDYQNGYAFSASGYQNEGIPIVTMAQIGLNGQFQFDENKVNYWSSDVIKDLKSFTLYKGDLIMSMTDVTPEKNLIGRMAIVNQQGPLFLNQRVGLIRINKNLVNPIILKHLSNMRPWRTYSKAIASLGVQANIGTTDIKNGTFWLPKIEEQNAISQVLSDMDLEIEALEAKKERKRIVRVS
jgi:type I restriction enzyme S subunit